MQADGKKKLGRFIKAGSSILDKLSLTDFSFDDISEARTILPDNTKKTIIHAPYHEAQDLKSAVKPFVKLDQELVPAHLKRPVITPLDFSKDWKKTRFARRIQSDGLEDEFDYEDAMAHARAERASSRAPLPAESKTFFEEEDVHNLKSHRESDDKVALSGDPQQINTADTHDQETRPIDPEKLRQFPSQLQGSGLNWGSIDIASKAISELGHKGSPDISGPLHLVRKEHSNKDETSDFIPIDTNSFDPSRPQDPEFSSSQTYKSRMAEKILDQDEIKNLIEEEKAQGYRDGFRIGEEKAELQMRSASKDMLDKMQSLIDDFHGLQKTMMDNVQENFFIVCQALAEALLKREFTIHPDAFNTVMEKAISESIEPGQVKIRIHPDTYDRIAALGKNKLMESMVKDADIPPGDFKLESQMSVVDVNIGKLVAQLLSQADLNLFVHEEKAG